MSFTNVAIPAAQYLRMSTEHQQFSFENQRAAIHSYAANAGFTVICTYSDAGKSGLVLKERDGLGRLLNDVVGGSAEFKVILVYDVSRWGRFQDADEAAHYEFLCKSAGIRVHYCAEQFSNDNSLGSSMLKALKRVMAGEFSRELSVKVNEGSKRVSQCGFRTGGMPGYGLRRMLLSANRDIKFQMSKGERKSLQSDRVILVPGPDHEVRCVREIFRMFVEERKWPAAIATELRRNGISYSGITRTAWYAGAVSRILKNPKYCGCSVFGQSIHRLHTRRIANPRKLWAVTKGAWQPVVDEKTFDLAQNQFDSQTIHKTDDDLLCGLRQLLKERGTLSEKLLGESDHLPSIEPFVRRFGSLSEAFEKIGFIGPKLAATRTKRTVRALRDQLIAQIVATNPKQISVVQIDGHFRPRLHVSGLRVSVFVCRCAPEKANRLKWILNSVSRERGRIALVARLDPGNRSVMDFFVLPDTRGKTRYRLAINDPWLDRGQQLYSIADFVRSVDFVNGERRHRQGP